MILQQTQFTWTESPIFKFYKNTREMEERYRQQW